MLVARRDPPIYSGANKASSLPDPMVHAAHMTPPQSRFITALQVIGSLLAIPVGLASGYSIYHANFSTEARCQGLRANIVSMLDKSADASTLRTLVRRDVISFEHSCGSVDPNAVSAFKTLLDGKPTAPVKTAHVPARAEKTATAKPVLVKQAQPAAVTKPAAHHNNPSDVNWLATVRRALVHEPDTHREAIAPTLPHDGATLPHPLGQLIVPVTTPAASTTALTAVSAPALPSPAAVAVVPAPSTTESHPVPPASIPAAPPPKVAMAEPIGTGFNQLIAKVPLLKYVIGR